MAHLPTLPDPSPRRSPHGQKSSNHSQFSFTELTQLLGQHGAGPSSEDLALDLLLHEVVSQACAATNAAAAAIALKRNGEFICRATSGKHAPDLGSHLSADAGLSGASIQSREIQRCDDTETDTRVDAAACRRLGVRSLVIVPLLKGNEAVGVLEVFSPHAHVFTDRDVKNLSVLSQQIVDTMFQTAGKEEEKPPSEEPLAGNEMAAVIPRKDPWIPVLRILIVALAVLLGWMLGHRGLSKATQQTKPALSDPVSGRSNVQASETASPGKVASPAANNPSPASTTPAKVPRATVGGLSVYESGKLVFTAPARADSIAAEISPTTANAMLIARVEPDYPDAARLAHIQGPVVLQVDVNEKGSVQGLRALSGNSQLVTAAADAVKQWRYKPYAPKGEALNFQTQVTVDFKLP